MNNSIQSQGSTQRGGRFLKIRDYESMLQESSLNTSRRMTYRPTKTSQKEVRKPKKDIKLSLKNTLQIQRAKVNRIDLKALQASQPTKPNEYVNLKIVVAPS